MNNSVFGNMMENIHSRRDVKLATTYERYAKLWMKPSFESQIEFGPDFIAMEMGRLSVVMSKLVYQGQAILDLSKITMYRFHYDYAIPKWGDNLRLCYMDTDCLVYHIHTDDFYQDIALTVDDWFDTSNYSLSIPMPLTMGCNKKIVGLMKNEVGGGMTDFVALKSKLLVIDYLMGARASNVKEFISVWLEMP